VAEERRRFQAARKGVLRLHCLGDEVAACVLRFPEGEARLFPPGNRAALRQTLEQLDFVVGFDPRGDFERVDADLEGRRFLDVAPPFALAGRRVSDVVHDNLPWLPRLAQPAEYARWWTEGNRGELLACLERDARTIHAWYRLAVARESVACETAYGVELWRVEWNLGHEPTLRDTLDRALKERRAVTIELVPGCAFSDGSSRLRMTPLRVIHQELDGPTYDGFLEDGQPVAVDLLSMVGFAPLDEGGQGSVSGSAAGSSD